MKGSLRRADAIQFRGFKPAGTAFFEALAANNNREWFLAHKEDYEREVRAPAIDLVADLCSEFVRRDIPLHATPKQALFRVNRDIRFARDKSPYKTNVALVLSRSGGKRDRGLFYFQHGVVETFAAAGFYQLEPDDLAAFRAAVLDRKRGWRKVEVGLEGAGLALSREDATARLPRGFDAAQVSDLTETIKLKSFIVSRDVAAKGFAGPGLVGVLADFVEAAMPLLRFGWRVLEEKP